MSFMNDRPQTPLLDQVIWPSDLRALKPEQLRQLADELRQEYPLSFLTARFLI